MKKFFAGIIYCLLYVVSLLPLGVHYFFSNILAFILKEIVRYRSSVLTVHIYRSSTEIKPQAATKLASD